jgi:Ankyrin repeats (many copies)
MNKGFLPRSFKALRLHWLYSDLYTRCVRKIKFASQHLLTLQVNLIKDRVKAKPMSISAAAPVFQGQYPVKSIAKHLASGGRLDVRCPQTQHSLIHWLLYVLDEAPNDSIPRGLKMLKRLLALGIDVNSRDDEGTTALMMSCEPEYKDHCKALLDAGADVD